MKKIYDSFRSYTFLALQARGVRNLCQPIISSEARGSRVPGQPISSSEARG